MFGNKTREWRCQVVAHAEPLPVIIFKGKHTFIGAVIIGEELAQRSILLSLP